jgi:hypothetical protein
MAKWVLCSERLPAATNEDLPVIVDNGKRTVASLTQRLGQEAKWWIYDPYYLGHSIIAWLEGVPEFRGEG